MDVMSLIKTRRSIRSFSTEPVPDDILEQLVEAGCWAPSGSNAQACEFIVVRDGEKIKRLQRFAPGLFVAPPVAIVVCVDRERALARGGPQGRDVMCLFDAAMAAQNIMLLAHSLGLGTCVLRGFDQSAFRVLLNLPPDVTPELLITLGFPKQVPKAPERRPLHEVLHYEGWNR
ncbi:MAG: nitroreductase family protein [Chloroflexota bacterium]